ncbi:MAG: alpha/beta hydrolase domain-containing protein, partial [Candidatus Aminicenantales bacterium]
MLIPAAVSAEVVKVEITSREVISGLPELIHTGPYEVIKGIIYLEVDPGNPANQQIVDLRLAPRNGRGRVELSTDFELHKPVDADRGNHRLMYFVNNRGNKIGNWHFNHEAGKNWLYSRGYSYLWCGWNCDVIESDQALNIRVPVITENGRTVTGTIYSEIIPFSDDVTYSQPLVWGGSLAYPPVTLDNSHATLTKRQYRGEKPAAIPRDSWSFARLEKGRVIPDPGYLYIKEGFTPGWLYDLVYTGKDPKVTGLGLAAIRDVVSFFKHEKADREGFANPLAGVIDYTYAWGHSQSARLLNHFVYQNFNGDENKRMVFDGIMANCPGAGKGQFNSRFAQFTRHGSHHEDNLYPVDFFPLATVEQWDPITGQKGDAFVEARKSGLMPKMMFINSSTDYWTRAASLLHTDVEGKKDIETDAQVRIYAIAGRAHTDSRIGIIGRALLTALDEWVSLGIEPPASQIPRISDGTLVTMDAFKKSFPHIPGVIMPESFYHPYRLDPGPRWQRKGIADNVPPKTGPKYVCLVPQVDEDGNEMAGIRLPEIEAPLATYTGWSMRNPSFSNSLRRNAGAVWPLPRTAEERQKKADPRKSILERYPAKKDFLMEVSK